MGYILTGDQQRRANKRLGEILRQFGQDEYPYDPERALDALQNFHEGRLEAEEPAIQQPILRLVSGGQALVLDETDGTDVIPGAKDLFPAYIDSNFVGWGADEASGPTPERPVKVYELARDVTFAQMFGSVSTDHGRLCLTQSQIIGFVRKYYKWIRTNGYGTFFLFKSSGELFVASVGLNGSEWFGVSVSRFGRVSTWSAGYGRRVVLPQLRPLGR